MNDILKTLYDSRNKAVVAGQSIVERAEKEKREVTQEEEAEIRKHFDEANTWELKIQNRLDADKFAARMAEPTDDPFRANPTTEERGDDPNSPFAKLALPEYRAACMDYYRHGETNAPVESMALLGTIAREHRALSHTTGNLGGYAVPTSLYNRIRIKRDEATFMRQLAFVLQTTSDTNIPLWEDDGTTGVKAENTAYTDSDPTLGQATLSAHKVTRLTKVPEELLQDSIVDIANILADRIGQKFAQVEQSYYLVGTGSGEPSGIFPTATNTKTLAGASAVAAADLFGMFFQLEQQYHDSATWIVKPATMSAILQLKGTDNYFFFSPQALSERAPMTIFGRPVRLSSYVPAIGTGLRSMLVGDIGAGYWIGERSRFFLQRLNELYAASGQVGFRAFQRIDGVIVNQSAIVVGVHP